MITCSLTKPKGTRNKQSLFLFFIPVCPNYPYCCLVPLLTFCHGNLFLTCLNFCKAFFYGKITRSKIPFTDVTKPYGGRILEILINPVPEWCCLLKVGPRDTYNCRKLCPCCINSIFDCALQYSLSLPFSQIF